MLYMLYISHMYMIIYKSIMCVNIPPLRSLSILAEFKSPAYNTDMTDGKVLLISQRNSSKLRPRGASVKRIHNNLLFGKILENFSSKTFLSLSLAKVGGRNVDEFGGGWGGRGLSEI